MKPVEFSRQFKKSFAKRVASNPKLLKAFDKSYGLFTNGARKYPINDHALIGEMRGLRAFSAANDLRVVYRETQTSYEFLDIGSHNQVY